MEDAVGWIVTLSLAIGLAACAGLRAWLPLLLLGVLGRLGVVELQEGFTFISSTPALVLFVIATVIEVGADKVPALDHALDVVSTFIRPAAGALVAAAALYHADSPLFAAVIGLMVGAPTALVPHAAKTTARAASTTFTAGLANPMISVAEDVAAVVIFVVSIVLPIVVVIALLVVVALLVRWRLRVAARAPTPATAD